VAIIAILAAIAVPNFLEAQTRSKVARVKADMRSIATALDSYIVDHNNYPWPVSQNQFIQYTTELTTPIAYMTSVMLQDPFLPDRFTLQGWSIPADFIGTVQWVNYNGWWGNGYDGGGTLRDPKHRRAYCISSYGPDRSSNGIEWFPLDEKYGAVMTDEDRYWRIYDATNGTISTGDIGRWGGEIAGVPQ